MSGYTPGPWQVDPNNPGDVNGPDGKDVAVSLFSGMTRLEITGNEPTLSAITREEAEANARLIAAAPELLEALEELMSDVLDIRGVDVEEYKPEGFKRARAAIAKATGEQS